MSITVGWGGCVFYAMYLMHIMEGDNEDLHALLTDACLWFVYRCYKVLIADEQYITLNDGIS
jgi:uncharacterized MAPEG superfamily protein